MYACSSTHRQQEQCSQTSGRLPWLRPLGQEAPHRGCDGWPSDGSTLLGWSPVEAEEVQRARVLLNARGPL